MSATEPRKRNRISSSCSSCRKRKTRCDRARPFCGRCIVDKCTSNCVYEDGVVPPENTLNDTMEINLLKHKISELETMISYQDLVISSFSKLDISPKDDHSTVTSDEASSKLFTSKDSHDALPDSSISYNSTIKRRTFNGFVFFQNNVVYLTPTSFLSYNLEEPGSAPLFEELLKSNEQHKLEGKDIGDKCYGEADITNIDYNKEIGRLPDLKTVNVAINYFFENYTPFVLFLNKELISQLYYLLDDRGSYCTINASKANKSSLIAILLIILRFTYILNPKILDGFIINSSYIECASGLLMSFRSFKLLSFNKIQGMLLLRVYFRHCLEDDDYSGSIGVLNSMLVASAQHMGISKYSYPENIVTKDEAVIWRNVWKQICYYDTLFCFDVGSSPVVPSRTVPDDPNLMVQVTKALNTYLHKVNPTEDICISETLSVLNELTKISNQRSLNQIIQYPGDSIYEAALEFTIRLDLIYKEFVLYFMLYTADETSERIKYLSSAFERVMIILKLTYELTTSRIFFNMELDQFISPRIWVCMRFVVSSLATITKLVMEHKFSIIESFKYFKSPDSSGVMAFIDVDFTSDYNTMRKIISKVQEVYVNGSLVSHKYYTAFKGCVFIRKLLVYLSIKYEDFMIPVMSNGDFGWIGDAKFDVVYDGWHKKVDHDNILALDMLFAGINHDMDDFINELGAIDYGNIAEM